MNISESVISRKGARSPKDVPQEVLDLLNRGLIETVNLSEWLAVEQKVLLPTILSDLALEHLVPEFIETLNGLKKQTAIQLIAAIGQLINDSEQIKDRQGLVKTLSEHTSDTVRSWACYAVGLDLHLATRQKLEAIRPYAADAHFGVREIAWMAIRHTIIADLETCLSELSQWSESPDENLRRFASEATRPRGVWCPHIDALKDQPELALDLLEPLKSDSSKYVRDSVGNWLNDASKTKPEWVTALTNRWAEESNSKETTYIIKKACRTMNKK